MLANDPFRLVLGFCKIGSLSVLAFGVYFTQYIPAYSANCFLKLQLISQLKLGRNFQRKYKSIALKSMGCNQGRNEVRWLPGQKQIRRPPGQI